ncbi:quinone oxidoreductase family protein [Singulisphaera acidiphila]|uniref:Zn-dependent oxidoreductase, NADPH:quinone reductase n=3 Tax=Singulisphaera acidiphila TaxID=466153 RepID=L0DH54_SINAD|nr:zinc-binding alcohol dehydrogenase family protein [Singulisphaera acidiphila]AGA27996.1 Zn-dependent oxidoreductase, NADPH:quinone reductase [Singulisphaera acidiphila DSM 18658]
MRALCFDNTGSLDCLTFAEVERPKPQPGEVLVRVRAAAINPSDVKNVLGKMAMTTVPRTPGRDFAGMVEDGPPEWVGREVFGTGGDLGFRRDGSHAEYLVVPAEAVLVRPDGLAPEAAAALGLAYMTAWAAVIDAAGLREGETVLITGVTGAVGGAAARIAHWKGARVLGTVRKPADRGAALGLPVDQYINLGDGSLPESVRSETAGRGVDVVLDVVGGSLFEPCLRCLTHRGRHVAVASTGDGRVGFDLVDFYRREGRIYGVDTLKLGFAESAAVLRGLMPGIEQGSFPPPDFEVVTLEQAVGAYGRINDGTVRKKPVITFPA